MILGVSGLAGSGKDTFAKFLVENHGFVVVSLADPLKRICKEVFDFTDEQLWGPSEKRNAPDERYPRFKPDPMTLVREVDGDRVGEFRDTESGREFVPLTPRYALQKLGTEWGRDCYQNVWVEYAVRVSQELLGSALARYNQKDGLTHLSVGRTDDRVKGIAIPDVRFQNEIEGIRKAGGKVIRIVRPGAGLKGVAALHASEVEQASIPNEAFDLVVENTGTLDDLRKAATSALVRLTG